MRDGILVLPISIDLNQEQAGFHSLLFPSEQYHSKESHRLFIRLSSMVAVLRLQANSTSFII